MMYLRADYSDQLLCNYSIFIKFSYNAYYVQLIKSLPERRYNSNSKEWEIPYSLYTPFIELINSKDIPYNADDFVLSCNILKEKIEKQKQKQTEEQNINEEVVNNTHFKLEPRDYQKQGIIFGVNNDKFLLADEQGLGKSLQCLNIATLKKGGQHCLIIVGYDSLQWNWVNEVEKCTNETAYVLGQREVARGKNKGTCRKGTMEERIEDLKNIKDIDSFFIVTSVSTLRHNEKIKWTDKNGKQKTTNSFIIADIIENLCKEGIIGRVIFDEGQVVKNYTSLQTKALLKIKSCPYKIIATGTPIMNQHIDLFPLLTWLDKEKSNFFEFRNKYCILGGFKGKQVIGNKNGDVLNKQLSSCMLRRKKDDVLDLPEKIIIDEFLEMDLKQQVLYDKIKREAKSNIAKMKGNRAAIVSMIMELRKVTCHPKWIDEKYKDSVKFERVHQLVNEIVQNERKAIIFSNWATPINWLFEEFINFNPAIITGATKDRMEQVNKFQNDNTCKLILGTGGAMGTGLTLTAASNVIFIDEPWNKALKDQWTDRAHRIGTKQSVNVYTLMCKNTYDGVVHKTVSRKGLVADNVVDGVPLSLIDDFIKHIEEN